MNKAAVVLGVGAERGLGAAVARRFAKGGLHIVANGRTQGKLDAAVASIEAEGGTAETLIADATNGEAVAAMFADIAERHTVDAVIYNVGNNAIIPFDDLEAGIFEEFWRVCCLGGFHTAKAALPILVEQGHGTLLFTGASASMRGKPNFAHFAAAKSALRTLAQSLAREYGPKGIHVGHIVVDGVIDGEIVRNRFGEYLESLGPEGSLNPDDIAETYWQMHKQGRSAWTHELEVRPFKENW